MKEWTGANVGEFSVMTRAQVRAFDAWAVSRMHIPAVVLMENAARNAAQVVLTHFKHEAQKGVCVFCGAGNNGGDGFSIARHLVNRGIKVNIALCADPDKLKGEAQTNFIICHKMNISMQRLDLDCTCLFKEVKDAIGTSGLLVDAVLGTGLESEVKNPMALLISCMNAHHVPIVALDIPSGMDCDTGEPMPVCVEAAATVTFAALKKGFAINPESKVACGRIFVADIGITPAAHENSKH